jgi:hypothetical protein
MQRSWFFAVLSLMLAMLPVYAAADSEPTPPPGPFTIDLERDGSNTAAYIEPRSDAMAAISWADSTFDYVPLYRIRRIEDANGMDQTSEVLRRGRRLGSPLPKTAKHTGSADGPAPWKTFRFLAGPGSVCGSYLITDCAIMSRDRNSEGGYYYESIDLGYARNLGGRHSIGLSGFLGFDTERADVGLRARLSRWVSPTAKFDLSPGVILASGLTGSSRLANPGFSCTLGTLVAGRFGLLAEVSSVPLERQIRTAWWYGSPEFIYRTRETTWHFGFRLGGQPGAVAAVPLLLLLSGSQPVRLASP